MSGPPQPEGRRSRRLPRVRRPRARPGPRDAAVVPSTPPDWPEVSFEDRMAAIANLQNAFVRNLRTAVNIQTGDFREGSQHIQLRQGTGGPLNFFQAAQDGFTDTLEQFVFQFQGTFFRAQDFPFHFFQFGRDKTLTIGNGLLADVMLRNFVQIGFGHFNVITKHRIEADLQGIDASLLNFLLLQFRYPIFAAAHGVKGSRVEGPEDLAPTLEAAFKQGGVHLVCTPIDYSENIRVLVNELRDNNVG